MTTRLVQHCFSMFRNIRFDISEKPTCKQLGLRIILTSSDLSPVYWTSVPGLYVLTDPIVVLYNYAATTTASLVKPKAAILAKVLPVNLLHRVFKS